LNEPELGQVCADANAAPAHVASGGNKLDHKLQKARELGKVCKVSRLCMRVVAKASGREHQALELRQHPHMKG